MKHILITIALVLSFAQLNAQQGKVEVRCTFTNNINDRNTLVVGVAPDATDSLDVSLGEQEIPPLFPPEGLFATLTFKQDGETIFSKTDFKPSKTDLHYSVTHVVQFNPPSKTRGEWIQVLWAKESFSANIDSVVLTDRITNGSIVRVLFDSKNVDTIKNGEIERLSLTIYYNNVPVSVKDAEHFMISPNPANEAFYLSQPRDIQVYSAQGILVLEKQECRAVSTSQLANGMYTVKAVDKNGRIYTQQIVVFH